ncbi:MAG: hypothetical protein PVF58_20740 [Candidatus Methanofastidiosia archaeon]|jgi:hypothetical protein
MNIPLKTPIKINTKKEIGVEGCGDISGGVVSGGEDSGGDSSSTIFCWISSY